MTCRQSFSSQHDVQKQTSVVSVSVSALAAAIATANADVASQAHSRRAAAHVNIIIHTRKQLTSQIADYNLAMRTSDAHAVCAPVVYRYPGPPCRISISGVLYIIIPSGAGA